MKAEYRRQFIDVNFYGMQSAVKNPMTDPNWRFNPEEFNTDKETEALKQLELKKKALSKTQQGFNFKPTMSELPPQERTKIQTELLNRFKENFDNLQANQFDPKNAKYQHLLAFITPQKSPAKEGVIVDPRFASTTMRKAKNGKLWGLLDKLKCQKGEEMDSADKNKVENKNSEFVKGLDS